MAEKKCPFCAELIKREAIKCKHCGSDLPPEERKQEKGNVGTGVLFVIALLIVVGAVGAVIQSQTIQQRRHQSELAAMEQKIADNDNARKSADETRLAKIARADRERQYGKFAGTSGGIEIYGTRGDEHYITGTAYNTRAKTVFGLKVTAATFTETGDLVDRVYDFLSELESGQVWHFRIPCIREYERFTVEGVEYR